MTKCVYRTMLPVLGALALWGAAPAIAQANVGWRLNGSPLTGSIATSYKGTMKLSDPGLFSLGAECEDATEGSSTFGGVGEITQWTASKCVSIDVCEKSTSTIEPLNLPWHSELVSVGGSIHVVLVSSGKGTPRLKLKCKVYGSFVEDKCTGNLEMATTNVESGLSATFDGGKLKCEESEGYNGSLEGSQKITASAGGKLSAEATEAETPPRWLVGGHSLEELDDDRVERVDRTERQDHRIHQPGRCGLRGHGQRQGGRRSRRRNDGMDDVRMQTFLGLVLRKRDRDRSGRSAVAHRTGRRRRAGS